MTTAVERVRECYKTVTTDFGEGGEHYDGAGHRGADYRSYDGEPIIAYDDMRIESIDYGSGLGWSVGLRRLGIGGFAGYAHVKQVQGGIGTIIRYGETIAHTAGRNDPHGTLWTGPHIHTTQGNTSAYNCSVGIRPLTDPVPTINAAKVRNPSAPAGGGGSPIPKEIKVKSYHTEDPTARSKAGRTITPGGGLYLHTALNAPAHNASNVVGGIGQYSITPHVYAEGAPGDAIDVTLIWQNTKASPPTNSDHYIEHLVFGPDGKIKASREFKRYVAAGYAVYVRVNTPKTNKQNVKLTCLDCDSFLFVAA